MPKVYWALTSKKVLTLEYAPGIKVSDKKALVAKGVDPAVIARYSVECYLQQILVKGLFHADPHPGNIAVDATDPAGNHSHPSPPPSLSLSLPLSVPLSLSLCPSPSILRDGWVGGWVDEVSLTLTLTLCLCRAQTPSSSFTISA